MQVGILEELLATALIVILGASILGYLGQKQMGAVMLTIGATVATSITMACTFVGTQIADNAGGWVGLVLGIALGGLAGVGFLSKVVKANSFRVLMSVWLGFCTLCIFGHLVAGWIGLLLVTLPAIILFCVGLYRVAGYILPLHDKKKQRASALRSLLTFTLGTNYPYYVARRGKIEQKVSGNVFGQFFAGPGIIISDCDQVAYRSDGVKVKDLAEPGVAFTGMFETKPRVIDLRPHLRSFFVHALTADGIVIKVLVFIPFQIRRGGGEVTLGNPFPFQARAIYDLVAREPVDRGTAPRTEQQMSWNEDLIPVLATRIVQRIINRYTVDALVAMDEPEQDPRKSIVDEMVKELKQVVQPYGIEIIGGGISNLDPQMEEVAEQRLRNWETLKEAEVVELISKGETAQILYTEQARAEAEAEIVFELGRVMEESITHGAVCDTALVLRFIDCLGEMVNETEDQWPLAEPLKKRLDRLRGEVAPRHA